MNYNSNNKLAIVLNVLSSISYSVLDLCPSEHLQKLQHVRLCTKKKKRLISFITLLKHSIIIQTGVSLAHHHWRVVGFRFPFLTQAYLPLELLSHLLYFFQPRSQKFVQMLVMLAFWAARYLREDTFSLKLFELCCLT